MCDVREKSCFSRKETTNENVVKVKESLNVAVVYWHCIQFIGIAYSLLALHIVYWHCVQFIGIAYSLLALRTVYWHCVQFTNRKALLFSSVYTGEVNSQLLLCAKFGVV